MRSRPVSGKIAKVLGGLILIAGSAVWGAISASRPAADVGEFLQAGRKAPIENVRWKKVLAFPFDKPEEIAACTIADGTWEVRDGKLWAQSGEKNRTILLGHVGGQTVRVEFEAAAFADEQGRIGDLSLLLNAGGGKSATGKGYALTTGSYYNTCTTFYREGRKLARTEYSPVESGKANRVIIEIDRGHLRYWLNDQIILEAWDSQPLTLDAELWLGLRTYATKLSVDNLTVSLPEGTDLPKR